MSSYLAQYARSLEEALALVASGVPYNVINRLPLGDLMDHAALVQDGLFDFDGTLTAGSQWRTIASTAGETEELRQRSDGTVRDRSAIISGRSAARGPRRWGKGCCPVSSSNKITPRENRSARASTGRLPSRKASRCSGAM